MKKKYFGTWLAILVMVIGMSLANLGCEVEAGDGGDETVNNGGGNGTTCVLGDTDNDGICDDIDPCIDADNDNVCDGDETCTMGDTDNDGICDNVDPCIDADHNGLCDDCMADVDEDLICDDEDPCIDANHNGICDDQEEECVLGDQDNDGICDDIDTCIDVNGDNLCDGDGLIIIICFPFRDELTNNELGDPTYTPDGKHDCPWAQAAYENPNDGDDSAWHAVRDVQIGASGCAMMTIPVGYPELIEGAYYDSTRRRTDSDGYDDIWDPASGDYYTDWCNLTPESITVGDIFYEDGYTSGDYEQGYGYWACHTYDGTCPGVLNPPN